MELEAEAVFDVVDLLGVLTNGILGGVVARQLRMDLVGFVVLAIVSGLGGGMIRDIAVGRLPAIFGGNTLYATSALLASGLMALLSVLGHPTWGMAGAIVLSAVLSVSARRFGWRLPGPANLSPGALKRLRRRPTPGKHTRRG